jgi:hypothetical protein
LLKVVSVLHAPPQSRKKYISTPQYISYKEKSKGVQELSKTSENRIFVV